MGDAGAKIRTRTRNIPKQVKETPFGVFLWGGHEKFDRRRDVYNELSTNPMFAKDTGYHTSLARKDAWTKAALQSRELIEIKLRKKWPHRHFMDAIRMTDWFLPVQPQFRIFMSNLERQMSDEQKAIWVPKAERFEIFGCYPQTELGHGSNVSGIETTATFDRLTDEFIINSPTISSTKYWIGGSGIWATHGIVVARLIVDSQNYGNHLFLTQLRDLDTQQLVSGVEIYEMGPKSFQGMLGADTGALRFNHDGDGGVSGFCYCNRGYCSRWYDVQMLPIQSGFRTLKESSEHHMLQHPGSAASCCCSAGMLAEGVDM